MGNGQANASGSWLMFALMTVASWGVYGVFLHTGQLNMADPANGRYKAFLFVGIAYFLTAVLAPLVLLMVRGADWKMPSSGMSWSLVAGIMGALGAFAVLLAYGAGGKPPVVMSIVFAGAPIVNAIIATLMHPPQGGLSTIKPQFLLGLAFAALGGYLVTLYRPTDAPKPTGTPTHSETKAPEKSQ
jgi:drug/metabolite transporter (DMT)-like permease